MHAARHQVVARPFGRGLGQHRRLDLEESVLVEVLPDLHRRAMPQRDVVLHPRPAKVEVPILQPHLFGDRRFVAADREGRHLRVVEQPDLTRLDLDLAGPHLRVRGVRRPFDDRADDSDHEFRPELLGVVDQRVALARDDLREAMTVAKVDEDERPKVADAMNPPEQDDVLADVVLRSVRRRCASSPGFRAARCS